jgi:hypothetical protein
MGGDSIDRLTDTVLQMKINLGHITETFQQQTFEICQQLAALFEEQKMTLEGCLIGIDAKLKECVVQMENYQHLYASLVVLREKLVQLGAAPSELPVMPPEPMQDLFAWRLTELRERGAI